jgi:hypothetical protein
MALPANRLFGAIAGKESFQQLKLSRLSVSVGASKKQLPDGRFFTRVERSTSGISHDDNEKNVDASAVDNRSAGTIDGK